MKLVDMGLFDYYTYYGTDDFAVLNLDGKDSLDSLVLLACWDNLPGNC